MRVLDERTLEFPDYPGNNMFNTLGNLARHPRAGLLFVDFDSGDLLQLTARVGIQWERETTVRVTIEAVREGYLLHYGEPRLLAGHDEDLALLAGDYLYALGIERLAALGDAEAVRELADLISLCAQSHAEGRPEDVPALWQRAVAAIAG